MFGKNLKPFAADIGKAVEGFAANIIGEKIGEGGPSTETPDEQLGKIHGKRKLLLIGINYRGQGGELRGCINDVNNIYSFLNANYRLDDVRVMTDDTTKMLPTRANIIAGFAWLRSGAQSGDSLIMHYSGHGGSVKDTDGDEEDGMDETLCPLDYAKAGQIVDDEVHALLCRGLPKGVRLTAIIDACHSESMLDLPYSYNINGDLEIIEKDKSKGIAKMIGSGIQFAFDGNQKKAIANVAAGFKLIMSGGGDSNSEARQKTIDTRTTEADVMMFSGCKDDQTSADAHIDGQATGAMSYALIEALKQDKNMDYTNMLKTMRRTLEGKYTQVPMLSAGRKLDLNQNFDL